MIEGFMFCLGVLLFFICCGVLLTFLREILIIIAVLAVVSVVGFFWLIAPKETEAVFGAVVGIGMVIGVICWAGGWVDE